jgi:hypothetical protein
MILISCKNSEFVNHLKVIYLFCGLMNKESTSTVNHILASVM